MRKLIATTMSATSSAKPMIRSALRRLLEEICSYTSERSDQNWTLGTSRAVSSPSKYSRSANPNMPAMRFEGMDWILLLYFKTLSL